MKRTISIAIAVAMVVTAAMGAGCRSVDKSTDQVSVRLRWFHQANTAGL